MLNNSRHYRILGVILVISKGGLSMCLCIVWEKRIMWRQHIFENRSYMADGIVTNTIMVASDTLLGSVKIWKKNTNWLKYKLTLVFFTCGYIKLETNIIISSKSSRSYYITREVIIGLAQVRVRNVTSWWTVKILKKNSSCWPLRFNLICQKYQNFIYVLFGMYPKTQCGNSGIKAVYNYKK